MVGTTAERGRQEVFIVVRFTVAVRSGLTGCSTDTGWEEEGAGARIGADIGREKREEEEVDTRESDDSGNNAEEGRSVVFVGLMGDTRSKTSFSSNSPTASNEMFRSMSSAEL